MDRITIIFILFVFILSYGMIFILSTVVTKNFINIAGIILLIIGAIGIMLSSSLGMEDNDR